MRHIRLLFAPRDHIVIEYPLLSILMPHGPSHRFIVVSGGGGVGRGRQGVYSFGLLCPSGWLRIKAIRFGYWWHNTLCAKN
jgi:hypothetical protein